MRGYSRRVGLKVTHRVLNLLWTRNYYTAGQLALVHLSALNLSVLCGMSRVGFQ